MVRVGGQIWLTKDSRPPSLCLLCTAGCLCAAHSTYPCVALVDRPTQLICISDVYLLSTDKYKRHSRGSCYPWTNLSNCMWSHELFFMMIFFGSLYCLIRKRVILLCTVVIQLSAAFKWMREKMIWYYLDVYKSPFKVLLIFVENLWRNNLSNLITSNPVFTTNP